MKFSISNLSWGNTPLNEVIPKLSNVGIEGIEIAPTAIWPDLDVLTDEDFFQFKAYLNSHNLVVSGVQSLLYGHPELQLFDQKCWEELRRHLEKMIKIGGLLGADVAVFGSPKNRLKGKLDCNLADNLAGIFLKQLIPCLEKNRVVLTLEPNASEYGADYLTSYEEVLKLCQSIDSKSIRPQIDTGCLWMAGQEPAEAFDKQIPHHIHISTPNLREVPGEWDFSRLFQKVSASDYPGWLVIEKISDSEEDSVSSAKWLRYELEVKGIGR